MSTLVRGRSQRPRRPDRPSRSPERRRAGWLVVLSALPWAVRTQLRRQDLVLHGAAVTFYAAIAGVPMLMLAVRLATVVVGEDRVRYLATTLERALPDSSGAGPVARTVIEQAAGTSWGVALFAAFAASLYGEGLRRAYASLARVDERRTGWRGRIAVLPVLAVAPLLLLAVLGITPWLAGLFSEGYGATALGVYVALNVDWIVVSVPLAWSFRIVSPDPAPLAPGARRRLHQRRLRLRVPAGLHALPVAADRPRRTLRRQRRRRRLDGGAAVGVAAAPGGPARLRGHPPGGAPDRDATGRRRPGLMSGLMTGWLA